MTPAEELSFLRLCHEELSREKLRSGIGLLEEKRLHSVFKRWVCDDFACHEQNVAGRGEKKRKFVADVLTREGRIFEIQTAKLYPLLKKMEFYMNETDHDVTVLHPLIQKKQIFWMQPDTGEIAKPTRSTLRETPLHAIAQLRPFLPYLTSGRLSLCLPAIEVEEYRLLDGWGKGGKRGSHRFELIPVKLFEVYRLSAREDYLTYLPELPAEFTAKEFGKLTRLGGYDLYNALAVYEGLSAVEKCGKRGRAALYRAKIEN